MTSAEHIETAKKFLADSDREFLDGDDLQASEKLWGAASHAVMAIAEQRGLPYRNHKELKILTQTLADEYDDSFIREGFSIAEKFHANFYHGFMEDFELNGDRPRPGTHRGLVERRKTMNGSIRIRVQATESSQPGTEPLILFEIGDESYLLSLLAATLMVNALQSQMQNPQIEVPNTSFWLPPDGAERLVRALRSQMQEAQRPFPPVHLEPDSADHLVKALKSQIQEAQRPFLHRNRN